MSDATSIENDGMATVEQSLPPRQPMELSTVPPPPVQESYVQQSLPISNAQPVWQFYLLCACTLGIYELIWFYRNWHLLKARRELRITPFWRAMFAPLFAWSFFKELFAMVEGTSFTPKQSSSIYATSYFLLLIVNRFCDRISLMLGEEGIQGAVSALSLISSIVLLVSFLPLIPAVRALNAFWEQEQPGYRMRTGLAPGAIVVVVLGGIVWLFIILGILMPGE